MKLVGYLRVSTDRQAEEGLGLEVQEQAIRRWAKDNGHRLVAIYRDEGVSGSNGVEDRVGLHDALEAVKERQAHGLVAHRLDRLAREFTVQEAVLGQVWKHDGSVFTLDMGGEIKRDDPSDPYRTAMRQMMGIFAQLERGMIAARMRAGRAAKADRGGYAYGSPAFGMRSEDGELVPDETEQAALERVRQLVGQGKSTRQIANVLTSEGYPTKRGGQWHSATVANIVRRLAGEA